MRDFITLLGKNDFLKQYIYICKNERLRCCWLFCWEVGTRAGAFCFFPFQEKKKHNHLYQWRNSQRCSLCARHKRKSKMSAPGKAELLTGSTGSESPRRRRRQRWNINSAALIYTLSAQVTFGKALESTTNDSPPPKKTSFNADQHKWQRVVTETTTFISQKSWPIKERANQSVSGKIPQSDRIYKWSI